MSRNADIMSTLDLSKYVSDKKSPEDEEIYSSTWKGNRQSKDKYKDALKRIKDWPKDDNNKMRYSKTHLPL